MQLSAGLPVLEVRMRKDQDPPTSMDRGPSENGQNAVAKYGLAAVDSLVRDLATAKTWRIEIPMYQAAPAVIRFKIGDLSQQLARVAIEVRQSEHVTCYWDSDFIHSSMRAPEGQRRLCA